MSEIVNQNPQNNPEHKKVRTRSTFPLQYHNYDTFRFGEYHPHFVMEGVAKDKISFRSSHDLRSYTLKAPLMEDISMKKDYFHVPMTAILPLNWDKFFANPVRGEDVPDDCGPACPSFFANYGTLMNNLYSRLHAITASGSTWTDVQVITAVLRFIVLGEYVFSSGSLLSSLGIRVWEYFTGGRSVNDQDFKRFDSLVDTLMGNIASSITSITWTDSNGKVRQAFGVPYSPSALSLRDMLQLWREDPASSVTAVSFSSGSTLASFKTLVYNNTASTSPFLSDNIGKPLNISRLAAYQLVVAEFYTNDQIDFVFDANRYRQLMWYYSRNLVANTSSFTDQFTVNGLTYDYDAFAGHVLSNIIASCIATSSTTLLYGISSVQVTNLSYIAGLFAYKRSLRFKDYFTGCHSQPLAVADSSFDASNTSVIDITKNIQKQRFLNAVNRVGASLKDYMKEIFDSNIAPDYTKPFYLGHTSDVIFGSEVENTGVAQQTQANSITSNLRSNGSRFEFTFEPDRDCILIGLTYFDVARAYTRTIDRQAFHSNRFDWFNPFMQFIGDQEVYGNELNSEGIISGEIPTLGYAFRHMEYKQRFNIASGGFIDQLPGWAFIADDRFEGVSTIDSDFIRSLNSELDRFYTSLTGYSLGHYFHFIVKNVNDCTASRPMAYAPSIL